MSVMYEYLENLTPKSKIQIINNNVINSFLNSA